MDDLTIVLLAAGDNKYSDKPCSVWSLGNGSSILDWQIDTFETVLPGSIVNIAVGFEYESIITDRPPHIFRHVLDWKNGGALQSFLNVIRDYSIHTLVMYGDTVFRPETLEKFNELEGDVTIGIDTVWKSRFSQRSQPDIEIAETFNADPFGEVEYTGLIKFSPQVMKWIQKEKHRYLTEGSFLDLIECIRQAGFTTSYYDVAGCWAEMNEQTDLVQFIMGSKAETLSRVRHSLKESKVCDQITLIWSYWKNRREDAINEVQAKFTDQRLIVRSSSNEEDSWETANAGKFESVLDIDCGETNTLAKAIDDVFLSYGEPPSNAQVLIQPFVTDVALSGVVFTCDLITGAPYYIINYDDSSGQTDSITSGQTNDLRTVIALRHEVDRINVIDTRLPQVIKAVQELEQLLGYNKLDIEFAVDNCGQCFTFQIRPIVVPHSCYHLDGQALYLHIKNAEKHFHSWNKKPAHIFGNYTIFSGMTDWNPAEIIGSRPNALATSLYNHIITEDIWAKQRSEFGYRDVSPSPLVHSFCAQPYVDCRASINSFIPADLPEDTASRLVDAYLELLIEQPQLHDKLELDIVFTIWVPTFRKDSKARFANRNLTDVDIDRLEQSLKKLTANALTRLDGDIASIGLLSKRFELLADVDLQPIEKIYQLIEDCRKFGTLAFSHAARAGFVSVTLLKSLVKSGGLSDARMLEFQASVPTVASDYQSALTDDKVSIDDLISQFGHLRPGTYDVNQSAYWENPSFYFVRGEQPHTGKEDSERDFSLTQKERLEFQNVLDQLAVGLTPDELVTYLRDAIKARERVKFDFTRNLSVALDLIINFGTQTLGLTREEVGFLTYDDIRSLRTGQISELQLLEFAKFRKNNFSERQLAKLPSVIAQGEDFFVFEQEKSKVNFITMSTKVADLVFVNFDQSENISGKIVAIPNADPGFDWIFAHEIAGLITQHGGANSHMAIRCAELGIPAAIGVGDKLYEGLHEGRMMLDCKNGLFKYV